MSVEAQRRRWLREIDQRLARVRATLGPQTTREQQIHTRVVNLLRLALRYYLAVCRGLHNIDLAAVTLPSEINDIIALAEAELQAANYVPKALPEGLPRSLRRNFA